MNKLYIVVFGLLTAVSTALAQSPSAPAPRVRVFAEPAVVAALPGDFDNAVGWALSVGATLDNVHSLEAQYMHFKSGAGWYDVTFTPMLATYKYRIALPGKFSVKVGGSMGGTKLHTSSIDRTAYTYGAVGGVSYALTERVSLDATALVLRLEHTALNTSGAIELFTFGTNIRF